MYACATRLNEIYELPPGDRVQMWFLKMQNYRIAADLIAYNAFIAAYAAQGNLDKAERLLLMACAKRLQPDLVTYNSLLHACARASGHQDD